MGTFKVQLIAKHKDGRETVINTTNDYDYLERIIVARDGTAWISDELCDLQIQVVR